MKKFFENFTDKKFLMSLIAVVAGILALFNIGDSTVNLVTSLMLIVLPVIGYVVSEGVLDWNKINVAISEILKVINDYLKENGGDVGDGKETDNNEEQSEVVATESLSLSKATKPYQDFDNKEREVILRIAEILNMVKK